MAGFRSAVERTQRFATHVFHEGRNTLSHIDRGLTTAAHIYHNVAPIVAPLAVHAMGHQRAQMETRHRLGGLRELRQGAREGAAGEPNG